MTTEKFKQEARKHQIKFKAECLGINPDVCQTRHLTKGGKRYDIPVQTLLPYDKCRDSDGYLIFFDAFRKEISDYIDSGTFKGAKGQMVTNLLRSEHIPFNIFFPLRKDLSGAAALFNAVLGRKDISAIEDIVIEYNPGTLNDGTAFDVYVPYKTIDGRKGGIGIEVKYTEKEYELKKLAKDSDGKLYYTKEYRETHDVSSSYDLIDPKAIHNIHLAENYRIPSEECGWFRPEYIMDIPADKTGLAKHVVNNDYRQIWRNHLLGASMILSSDKATHLDEFFSLTLYPNGNGHFCDKLWREYEDMLTPEGKATLRHITYENLFNLMAQCLNSSNIPELDSWIKYLHDRYIPSIS